MHYSVSTVINLKRAPLWS